MPLRRLLRSVFLLGLVSCDGLATSTDVRADELVALKLDATRAEVPPAGDVEQIVGALTRLGVRVEHRRGVPRRVSLTKADIGLQAVPQMLALARRLETIEAICFCETTLTADDFRQLASSGPPTLTILCTTISADDLAILATATKLEHLTLGGNRYQGDILPAIARLTNLAGLSLDAVDQPITGDLFLTIASLPKLTNLTIIDRHLADADLVGLCHCDSLTSLTIHAGEISDAIYAHLELKPNLKSLYLSSTQLTPVAAQHFRARHPEIDFSSLAQERTDR